MSLFDEPKNNISKSKKRNAIRSLIMELAYAIIVVLIAVYFITRKQKKKGSIEPIKSVKRLKL